MKKILLLVLCLAIVCFCKTSYATKNSKGKSSKTSNTKATSHQAAGDKTPSAQAASPQTADIKTTSHQAAGSTVVESKTTSSNASTKKPKIVIFTCNGGNGHTAACETLKDILPDCEIKLVRPIHDFFSRFFDEEEWYGSFLKNGWIRTGNFIARYPGTMFLSFRLTSFQNRFETFLKKEKPDLLISVIPLINYPAIWAAKHCNIPFMLITLDADLELWLSNMQKCQTHNISMNENVVLTVQMKTPLIEKQLEKKHIPNKCIAEVGCPLRKDFFTPKDLPAIRKEWDIPEKKKVIMLMRGSTGSNTMIDYVDELVKIDKPIHLLVCIGRNTSLIHRLNKIKDAGVKSKRKVSLSIIQFTPKIPDLMAVSDLLITQPSPNVCNEAMHMKLQILVDMTGPCLFWEKATLDWIKIRGCEGGVLKRMSKLNEMVLNCLNKNKTVKFIQKTSKCDLNFNTEIRKLVMKLLKRPNFTPLSLCPPVVAKICPPAAAKK
jgi:UDP-N-acetylglucosamine:LPS N-acetylglucosamine transferase